MNKPGSGKSFLVGLREARIDVRRLERDQQAAAALGACTMTPVVLV